MMPFKTNYRQDSRMKFKKRQKEKYEKARKFKRSN